VAGYLREQGVRDGELTAYTGYSTALYVDLDVRPSNRAPELDAVLLYTPSARGWVRQDLNAGHQRFVVTDPYTALGLFQPAGDPKGPPPVLPEEWAGVWPWYEPVVFRSGPYQVHRVTGPVTNLGEEVHGPTGLVFPLEQGGVLHLYARDPEKPDRAIGVEIYDGATLLTTAVADQHRDGPAPGGVGDGNHCFRYEIPARLKDGKYHSLRVKIAGTDTYLPGCPQLFKAPPGGPTGPGRPRRAGVEGCVESADGEQIGGWAWDPHRPNRPLQVDIYDGDVLLATVPADQVRPDLVEAGKGDGRHDFNCPTPARLKDGKPHAVRVLDAETNVELADSPKTVQMTSARKVPRR
jgi:hypothetical protein